MDLGDDRNVTPAPVLAHRNILRQRWELASVLNFLTVSVYDCVCFYIYSSVCLIFNEEMSLKKNYLMFDLCFCLFVRFLSR